MAFASGDRRSYGDGRGEPVAVGLTDQSAELLLALDPALRLGELYMDGRLIVEQGSIYDFLSLLKRNGIRKGATPLVVGLHVLRTLRHLADTQLSPEISRRNVAHHYDLKSDLFRLFLDNDMQYSCAYYDRPERTLEEAQLLKKRRLAAKLCIEPNQQVLDIGCGWGGLSLYLAQVAQARVHGVTLSDEQLAVAHQRSQALDLDDRVRFSLSDYRRLEGSYDRIVSVGMFEHVGRRTYDTFFKTTARLLKRKGIFVLHSIGRTKPLLSPSPFVDKYIFPDCYIPALSEVLPSAERAGWLIRDVEILPMHYADTLREWRRRFLSRRAEAVAMYDERFARMWEFYLAVSETAFRHDRLFVFQLQLSRHQGTIPTTRDYLAQRLRRLERAEGQQLSPSWEPTPQQPKAATGQTAHIKARSR